MQRYPTRGVEGTMVPTCCPGTIPPATWHWLSSVSLGLGCNLVLPFSSHHLRCHPLSPLSKCLQAIEMGVAGVTALIPSPHCHVEFLLRSSLNPLLAGLCAIPAWNTYLSDSPLHKIVEHLFSLSFSRLDKVSPAFPHKTYLSSLLPSFLPSSGCFLGS